MSGGAVVAVWCVCVCVCVCVRVCVGVCGVWGEGELGEEEVGVGGLEERRRVSARRKNTRFEINVSLPALSLSPGGSLVSKPGSPGEFRR